MSEFKKNEANNLKKADMAQLMSGQCTNNLKTEAESPVPAELELPDIGAALKQAAEEETEDERAQREFDERLEDVRMSVDKVFPEEQCVISVDDKPFIAKGDIHAIKAKQKHGKTRAISILVAVMLCGLWGRLKSLLAAQRILVIDTEQKAADTQLVYKHTLQMAGMPEEDIPDRFLTYYLRSFSREEKVMAVEKLILKHKPDVVFIDGIVDLMGNFNEVDESKDIIERLMRLSTKEFSGKDIAIVNVLHTNKAAEDHNMRGHAGTMLSQKAGTVLEVVKKDGIFTVSSSESRHQDLPAWSFRFDDDGNIVEADSEREAKTEEARKQRQEKNQNRSAELKEGRIAKLKEIIVKANGAISRKKLRELLAKECSLSDSSVQAFIKVCFDEKVIITDSYDNIVINYGQDDETESNSLFD